MNLDQARSHSALLVTVPLLWLAATIVTGCAPVTVTTGAFTQVARLETELKRGISTKIDVQRALGAPKGFGQSILPTDPTPREVWYYDDIEVIEAQAEPGGYIRANLRQQILLVFFEKEVLDGYMWFTNITSAR
jgi:hypothetical protein